MNLIHLTCPCHKKSALVETDAGYLCSDNECKHQNIESKFPIVNDIPVLISEENTDTVCSMSGNATYIERPLDDYQNIKKLFRGESKQTKDNCEKFINTVTSSASNPKVLIIGSGSAGSGTDSLWSQDNIEIHGVDIYGSNTVDVICDAHYLPIESQIYDGVWIQAVLEHVVEPQKVVAEIFRVLKTDGIVYAETPFMQQVHEGAYDFTRFTVLGHRYLFKNFDLIDMGATRGPEEVLAWSTRYLAWSISRSRKVGKFVGVAMSFIMRPLQFVTSRKSMYDASSGVYFMGVKREGYTLKHKDLVELYEGQYS